MHRVVCVFACLLVFVLVFSSANTGDAQTGDAATIEALETRVAELEGTVDTRGQKINAQRTQIAELKEEANAAPTEPAEAESGTDASNLYGPGLEFLPPGQEGEVAVVLQGTYDGNILPVIVRNNTDKSIGRVGVTASVHSAGGELIGAGGDQGFNPSEVLPGSYALGYIYFDGAALPVDATFEFNVTYSTPDSGSFSALDLDIVEAAFLGDRIVGELSNSHGVAVQGPIDVSIVCLTGEGTLLGHETGYVDQEVIEPGGAAPFQVSFYSGIDCTYFVLAASGYNF